VWQSQLIGAPFLLAFVGTLSGVSGLGAGCISAAGLCGGVGCDSIAVVLVGLQWHVMAHGSVQHSFGSVKEI